MDSYKKTLEWFKKSGHKVLEGIDPRTGNIRSWKEFGDYPDIVFQLSSWFSSTPSSLWFAALPLHCLLAYIPNGIQFAENQQGTFAPEAVFNKEIFNLVWRIYCDSDSTLSGYRKYQLLQGKNAVFSGYAKMDYFYEDGEITDEQIRELWKIPDNKNPKEVKRIIIAPHYSVLQKGWLLFSTFRENLWFMLYLAKKYKDKVSFVLKPHPNLRYVAVAGKMFKDYESYDKYLEAWDSLPNAMVVEEASYLELFATSDAMMTDSVSFLGEYLYVNKPLLLLTRPEQSFLELGRKVTDSYYKASGTDYERIEEFLQNVVIEGCDTMSGQREDVFGKELDYVTYNGCKASEFIYGDIMKMLNAG
jgi:CDP-glycerol glycerophosphotransferase (TagB/SpsB family)